MSALRSLTFTTIPKIGANPTFDRRAKIIALLEEQKLLLKDSKYTRPVRTWVKKDGQLVPVERQQRVLPWWPLITAVRNGELDDQLAQAKKPPRAMTRHAA
jgi:hypothetical protein